MNIDVIGVGKLKEDYLKDAQKEYLKRLSRFCKIRIVEVEEDSTTLKEADRIRKAFSKNSYTIALDIQGEKLNSVEFSKFMDKLMIEGKSDLSFIIGGSTGLDETLIKQVDYRFSMSDLTFPHQLARIILLEQVYRAFKLMKGETYHK